MLLSTAASAQELSGEDIIAKHIESIGKKEVRDQVSTLFAVGLSSFESESPSIKGGGKAIVVSDRGNMMFAISLNSKDYPFEKIGYFQEKVSLPFVTSGQRSLLGEFINEHPRILSEGLFGGIMSLRWPLAGFKGKPRIKSLGIRKVNGTKLYVLSYQPDGGGLDEFTIKLFFDPETFAHVRSEYHREFSPNQPRFGQANQLSNSEITLTERFADFKTVDGLTLPYTYSVEFSSNANTSTLKTTWGIKVSQYYVNQKLAPDFFTFDPK
jgi:hypothetical protein